MSVSLLGRLVGRGLGLICRRKVAFCEGIEHRIRCLETRLTEKDIYLDTDLSIRFLSVQILTSSQLCDKGGHFIQRDLKAPKVSDMSLDHVLIPQLHKDIVAFRDHVVTNEDIDVRYQRDLFHACN